MRSVRLFDPQQARVLKFDHFAEGIPGLIDNQIAKREMPAYKNFALEVDDGVSPVMFWMSNAERFPELNKLSVCTWKFRGCRT